VALVNNILNDTLDIIGIIGDTINWPVGNGSTKDHTLVRQAGVQNGTTNWSISSTQWDVYPQNDFSHLGAHTMTPCAATNPSLYFTSDTLFVNETSGSFDVKVGITNPNNNGTSVTLTVTGGTAAMGTDYDFTSPQTITFPANSATPITVTGTITNDLLSEGDESIKIDLSNPTNSATISAGTLKVTIIDNDGLSAGNVLNPSSVMITPSLSGRLISVKAEINSSLFVYDILGNEMERSTITQPESNLDLSNVARGLYFIRVTNNKEVVVKKVILQ